MSEKEPFCILGNGTCPAECLLNEYAVRLTAKLGDNFDPEVSRRAIILADVDHNVRVSQIATVMAKCTLESMRPEKSGSTSLPQVDSSL